MAESQSEKPNSQAEAPLPTQAESHSPSQKPKTAENSPTENTKPNNQKRSRALWWFTLFLVVAGISWGCLWFFYFRFHEWTDDAYANGNLIFINPVIPGAVVAFFADDTDLVVEGKLLVLLDDTYYRVVYERELATLASVVLQVRQLYDAIKVNLAVIKSRQAAVSRLKVEYEDRLNLHLHNPKAVASEDYIRAMEDYKGSQFDLNQAEHQLEVAIAAAGNTVIEKHPLIEQQKQAVRAAFYNLEHCSIFAPATGYVAQRTVDVGNWVTPTTNLMAIIPKDYVWVDANFKETQLAYMRIGQPATVYFDLYGSKAKYEGQVWE